MSNYYYERSKKCYRTKRNHHQKYNCECNRHPRYHTFTSGPLFRNADTDFIQVSGLNQTDEPQEEIAVLTVDELRRLLDAQNKRGYSDFQDYVIMNLL